MRDSITDVQAAQARAHEQILDALREESAEQRSRYSALRNLQEDLRRELSQVGDELARVRLLAGASFDRVPELRSQLLHARSTADYRETFADTEPLISVRIATYNRGDDLFERTIPSVLAQTYPNWELIVVGDHCDDDTEDRFKRLADERIRFVNQPHRGVYPADARQRWQVAGSPVMNVGAQLARGRWIAPLDDDDEFTADHLASLLSAALAGEFEMIYGRYTLESNQEFLARYPPEMGHFTFQAGMYMTALRFFEYEPRSWLLNEPADWNICRRMLEAGVRIGHYPEIVTHLHPTGPRSVVQERGGEA